jgi:hypothetical protein
MVRRAGDTETAISFWVALNDHTGATASLRLAACPGLGPVAHPATIADVTTHRMNLADALMPVLLRRADTGGPVRLLPDAFQCIK